MRKKKSEWVIERPDLLQVRTRFDYRDGEWHSIWYNRNGIVKEEIINADLYLLPDKWNFTTEQLKKTERK